jgi:hypothetical protein
MSAPLLPVAPDYLRQTVTLKPGERLHRLLSRLCDTYYDDLTEERIEELERHADQFRLTHADGQRFLAEKAGA